MSLVDYDDIERWSPQLTHALAAVVTDTTFASIRKARPEFIEDALDLLFELAGRDTVIDPTLEWLRSSTIAGYHGSRLTEDELASVRRNGLLPLDAETRRPRLIRALSHHPKWDTAAPHLDAVLKEVGHDGRQGHREGQAHLTLSRAGLVNDFDHYLTHGSEFDQQVAHALLGEEGHALLGTDGRSRIIHLAVPGQEALNAAHPHFSIEDLRSSGEVPNIAREVLQAWSFWAAYPDFDPRKLKVDRGMVFHSAVPAAWITGIETLTD
jgi:hypothetical protein